MAGSRLRICRDQTERLLLAALDYSIYRCVVYVAAKPPRSLFKTARMVHMLDGNERWEVAKDYLW